jgi:hypothetical protein
MQFNLGAKPFLDIFESLAGGAGSTHILETEASRKARDTNTSTNDFR